MYCTQCGKQIPNEVKFCQYCGTPTHNAPIEVKENLDDKNKSDDNYIWAYRFTESDVNNISVARHFIEQKRDYTPIKIDLNKKNIYVYQKEAGKKVSIIILYKQGNEVMIFGNERGYTSIRSRYLNKAFKGVEKEKITLQEVREKELIKALSELSVPQGSKQGGLAGVGGWLALFILGVFITAATNIIGTFIDFSSWGLIDLALGIYAVYVGYLLVKTKPHAIKHAKIYLAITILLGVLLLIVYYSNSLNYDNELLTNAWRCIFYGSVWLWYFSVSKRVKATYSS